MSLTVTLLGAPSVLRDGVPLTISTRKAVALVAYLAITGVPQTRDALATLFWPEAGSEHARGALRYTLAQLRAALGDEWIVASREQIGLAARADLEVDVAAVEARVARVHAHGHALSAPCQVCAPLLREAVALQRGQLLAGFSLPDSPAFDDWLLYESERLQRAQADMLKALIAGHRAAGAPAEAIQYAQRRLALDRFDDDANHVVLELLIESGQRGAARRHYDAYARLLRDELDVDPPRATSALLEHLGDTAVAVGKSGRPNRMHFDPAAPRPSEVREPPRAASPLVGRSHEVVALGRLLVDPGCRVLTLLGPGGSGKTRLAMAVAEAQQPVFSDGVAWVSLAAVESPGALAALAASAVGCPVSAGDDAEQRLLDYLRERRMLLILDNLEQLLPRGAGDPHGAVELVERLLETAPEVQLLVTSRVRLQLYQEQLYPVQGLRFPDWDDVRDAQNYAAVQLFVTRARRLQPAFALSATTAPAVVRIVRLLAGQPLALELAAGWIGSLQPDDIADELERGIDLLATDARNVPARHRSMRASYALSWQQLGPDQQAAQQALSVFRNGFTRAAAEAVAGATPAVLRALLDHSLVSLSGEYSQRYLVHELLRQFAAEQLAQAPEQQRVVHAGHAAFYLHWIVEQMGRAAQVQTASVWDEVENVRAAWHWAAEQRDLSLLGPAIDQVCMLFQRQGRTAEGVALIDRLIERLDPEPADDAAVRLLGQALAWNASFAIANGRLDVARGQLDRSLALLDGGQALAFAQRTRGYLELLSGDLATARTWLERGMAGYRACGDQRGMALALDALGRSAWLAGDYAPSRRHHAASLAIYRALDDRPGIVHALAELALSTAFAGIFDAGLALIEESRRLAEQIDDQGELLAARRHVAGTLYHLGSYQAARPLLELCIAGDEQIGNRLYAVSDRLYLASIQLIEYQYDEMTRTAEAMLAESRALRHDRNSGFALSLLGLAELGRGAYVRARERLEESLVVARESHLADDPILTQWGLCQVERALGNGSRARQHGMLAVELAANGRGARAACLALSALLGVLADEGNLELAIELETVVVQNPYVQRAGFFYDYTVQPLTGHIAEVPAELVRAARERGRARELLATVGEMLAMASNTASRG